MRQTFKDVFAEDTGGCAAAPVAVNNVGGGQVAGLGVGPEGTNNIPLNKRKKPLKRSQQR